MTNHKRSIEMGVRAAMSCAKRLMIVHQHRFSVGIVLLTATFLTQHALAVNDDEQLSRSSFLLSVQRTVPTSFTTDLKSVDEPHGKRVNLEHEVASQDTRNLADWVVNIGDNQGMPFMIIDKIEAKVFAFNVEGRLLGTSPVLLGLARGDDSVTGIGERKLASIRPEERITPAGRFVASLGRNLHGDEILWIDYAAAISLHRVVTARPEQRRLARLESQTPLDNRISFGCINVPVKFYDNVVSPTFTGTNGIVYVLPETRSAQKTFGFFDAK